MIITNCLGVKELDLNCFSYGKSKWIEKEIAPEDISSQEQPSPRDEWKEYFNEKREKAH